jgi:hypothetical protein
VKVIVIISSKLHCKIFKKNQYNENRVTTKENIITKEVSCGNELVEQKDGR